MLLKPGNVECDRVNLSRTFLPMKIESVVDVYMRILVSASALGPRYAMDKTAGIVIAIDRSAVGKVRMLPSMLTATCDANQDGKHMSERKSPSMTARQLQLARLIAEMKR